MSEEYLNEDEIDTDNLDIEGSKSEEVKNNKTTHFFIRVGLNGVKLIAKLCLTLINGLGFVLATVFSLIMGILKSAGNGIKLLFHPFVERMHDTDKMHRSLKKAKKQGKKVFVFELLKNLWTYLFGENGIFYTGFNYILPILSIAFLFAVVKYGSELEYGISVEFNGKEIGIINNENDFDIAAKEVQERISYVDDSEIVMLDPKFSLRIVSGDDHFMTSDQLINTILNESSNDLTEAYGIYVDGSFVGAVENYDYVADSLTEVLINYDVDGYVRDMKFGKSVEYVEGIYLSESLLTEHDAVELLTAQESSVGSYVVQDGDSIISISNKYNMSEEEFKRINPLSVNSLESGNIVRVIERESFLPIQYIRELETVSFIDYGVAEVETSLLNVGSSEILVKGERGEKHNKIEVTYVDGIERSRVVLSSEVVKEPVTEQVGIGTYTAKPASATTVLTGSGQFAWPVDGGYISDTFISDRNHKGLDIAAPAGNDVYAAGDGVVIAAGWNTGGYGYFVMIDHLDGYETLYGHCSGLYVTTGQTVTRGQLIGAIGTTGNSTGNHCHLEVRYNGAYYNPADFINTVGEE